MVTPEPEIAQVGATPKPFSQPRRSSRIAAKQNQPRRSARISGIPAKSHSQRILPSPWPGLTKRNKIKVPSTDDIKDNDPNLDMC